MALTALEPPCCLVINREVPERRTGDDAATVGGIEVVPGEAADAGARRSVVALPAAGRTPVRSELLRNGRPDGAFGQAVFAREG